MYGFLPEHPVEAVKRRKYEAVAKKKARDFHEILLRREEVQRIRDEEAEVARCLLAWERLRCSTDYKSGDGRCGVPLTLDLRQTSVERLLHPSYQQRARFHGMEEERRIWGQAVIEASETLGPVQRFVDCGEQGHVSFSTSEDKYRLYPTTCGCRHCPKCGLRRRREAEERLKKKLPRFRAHEFKFVTVTMKSRKGPLGPQLDDMIQSARRLRQADSYPDDWEYGWQVIECTFNARTQMWHPHLHMIVKGDFWRLNELSDAWMAASRGSYVVDISSIKDAKGTAGYITKYIGKGPDITKANDPVAMATDWVRAMKGRHMLIGFGDPPAMPEPPGSEENAVEESDWVLIAPLLKLFAEARAGKERGLFVLSQIFPGIKKSDYCGPAERAPP